jgi:glycosyltransferase involved in cell wall biosynthesis
MRVLNTSTPVSKDVGAHPDNHAAAARASGGRRPVVSLIIPMLNEREGLALLFSTVQSAIAALPIRCEIVVVDDGSTDGTRDVIAQELARFDLWQVLILSRNFGQQAAYRAGLAAAKGEAIVFLDADLQDPPELLPELIAKWREGFKVVTACRSSRAERGLRRWLFDGFHSVFHRLTQGTMPRNSGMFALVDRVVVDRLVAMREVNLFLPALKCYFGFPQTTVMYARRERAVGAPKQSLRKLFSYALNGLLSFSDLPLQWIGLTGVLVSTASFGYGAVLLLIKLGQIFGLFAALEVKGFTTLAVAVFCLSGIQWLCLGIIGHSATPASLRTPDLVRQPAANVETTWPQSTEARA